MGTLIVRNVHLRRDNLISEDNCPFAGGSFVRIARHHSCLPVACIAFGTGLDFEV